MQVKLCMIITLIKALTSLIGSQGYKLELHPITLFNGYQNGLNYDYNFEVNSGIRKSLLTNEGLHQYPHTSNYVYKTGYPNTSPDLNNGIILSNFRIQNDISNTPLLNCFYISILKPRQPIINLIDNKSHAYEYIPQNHGYFTQSNDLQQKDLTQIYQHQPGYLPNSQDFHLRPVNIDPNEPNFSGFVNNY